MKIKLFPAAMVLVALFESISFGQTCEKAGIGTSAPASKLEVKGCGNTSATSALNITNSSGNSLFFVRDDGYMGIGTITPTYKFDLSGTSSIYDRTLSINNFPMLFLPDQATTGFTGSIAFGNGLRNATTNSAKYNTAIGISALVVNTIGNNNTACGFQALYANTAGTSNTAGGTYALYSNVGGTENTGFGKAALFANIAGSDNTAFGIYSLSRCTAGRNTALGYYAGQDITTGTDNLILGYFSTSGANITTGSNNIIMGNNVSAGLTQTGSNQLNIGNLIFATGLGSAAALSTGNVGMGTAAPKSTLEVNGSLGYKVTTTTSSYTITATDMVVLANNGATAVTVTLPSAAGINGRTYVVKRLGTATVTVKSVAGTIDNVAAATGKVLAAQYDKMQFISDGTNWFIID